MKKEYGIALTILFIVVSVISIVKIDPAFKDNASNRNQANDSEIIQNEVRAIYISYIELSKYLDKPTVEEQKSEILKMVQNVKQSGFNWIILHVRSFSDSIYPSTVFPSHYLITRDEKKELELDILQEFIEQAHQENIQIHAWINPFRIRNDDSFQTIAESNPCFKWIGSNHIMKIDQKGIYYNPASVEVQNLVAVGVREIIENYDVDGIHLDDYFYPDPSKTIDLENYNQYLQEGGTLSIDQYRLETINQFIRKIYQTIQDSNKNILFGIAPDGNITNNYQENFADITTWLKEEGYVDYIMPQLYYGFQNETKPFIKTLNEWHHYIENKDILFIPALALYKTGNLDHYAKTGSNEWLEHQNIIEDQIKVARNTKQYAGFSLFRYDNFYSPQNEIMKQEVEHIKQAMQ